MAGLEQTNKDLMPAVLEALEKSEYFLFIDFKRERQSGILSWSRHRGSLFSHQELAIARFLGIEQLRFKEKSVRLEGIAELLQGRPIEFENRNELVANVRQAIEDKQWRSNWKNALRITAPKEFDPPVSRSPKNDPTKIIGNDEFRYIVIENLHDRKMALDCRVLCEFVPSEKSDIPPTALRDQVEQKWAGTIGNQAVAIRPKGSRRATALFVERNLEGKSLGVKFHQFDTDTDSAEAAQSCPPGVYLLKYRAVSANFPQTSMRFDLEISDDNEVTKFQPVELT
jgi:hypothetical protein